MSSGSSRTSYTSAPAWSAATPALASVRMASRTHPKLCLECTQPTAELRDWQRPTHRSGRGRTRYGTRFLPYRAIPRWGDHGASA